ncbi:MAG TPA: DUF1501 domain-containing protein [Alphaproteobacteria bacterium]|nr:DUF1501 domain-containing protein [Alphaproteobacteria bacterium]
MLSRRKMFALGAGLMAATSLAGVPVALARAPTDRRFVVVILRGALDGLAAVPPYADPDYRSLRGGLALPDPNAEDGMLGLDGRFGLHPALAPLQAMYQAHELAVVHAVATPYRSRSHFDGQDLLESGADTPHGLHDGWLNRALGLLGGASGADTTRAGLAVGQSVPLMLRGKTPVASWAPDDMPPADPDFFDRLGQLYAADPVFGPALKEGLKAQAMADDVLGESMDDPKTYGRGARPIVALRPAAQAVGKLLAAPAGPRVAVLEMLGWDTHAGQGAATGRLAGVMKGLGEGLEALKDGLGPEWRQTAVAVVTEFGRTVAINGTNGTDHGTGTVAFLAGGRIAGGRVIANWPGLGPSQLFEGRDLAPTTDLRAVLKALLVEHLQLPQDGVERVVFPNSRDVAQLRDCVRA